VVVVVPLSLSVVVIVMTAVEFVFVASREWPVVAHVHSFPSGWQNSHPDVAPATDRNRGHGWDHGGGDDPVGRGDSGKPVLPGASPIGD
jgi:hypothetical protein